MGFIEIIILTIPLSITAVLSFINFYIFIRAYFHEEETTLIHIALTFFFNSCVFTILTITVFLPVNIQISLFITANICAWLLFLEIGNAYFATFLNRSRHFERYIQPIFGAVIGFSIFMVMNLDIFLLFNPFEIEMAIFFAGIVSLLWVFVKSFKNIDILLDQFEGDELKLLLLAKRIFLLGTCCISFTFLSVFCWLSIKGIENLSLDIATWNIIDWIVYSNVLIYAGIMLGTLIQSLKINFTQINIPTLLNTLDSH
ncbi:MAG: hypothetical protein ACW964_13700 [Candidatus Hodarchaeales archaeon]|jgi:hypothetical protein